MAFVTYKEDPILEVTPVDSDIPSLSSFIGVEMGYYLCALKDKWVLPFKRTKVRLNIASITLPNNTFGILSANCTDYRSETTKVIGSYELYEIAITSKRLLPFKIRQGDAVAVLSVIPFVECHTLIHNKAVER